MKDDSWESWDLEDSNIESESLRKSLQDILTLPLLRFSRKHEVYDKDKKTLLEHLNHYSRVNSTVKGAVNHPMM